MAICVEYYNTAIKVFNNFDEITDEENVKYLSCKNNIKSFPDNFGDKFVNLYYFSCSENKLTTFPIGFGKKWTKLQHFYCCRNNITSLPDDFGSYWNDLQVINFTFNKLKMFPNKLGKNWNNLVEFYCSHNELTQFNIEQNLKKMVIFCCHNNKLSYRPNIKTIKIYSFEPQEWIGRSFSF